MPLCADTVCTAPLTSDPGSPAQGEQWFNTTEKRWKCQVNTGNPAQIAGNKWDATADPGIGNDNTEGYSVGSRWINITLDKEFVCLDPSTGAAVWTQTTASGSTDEDAIHDNVAGEIAAITEKGTPVSADLLVIEDSADSDNKKRVQVGNLPGGAPSAHASTHQNGGSDEVATAIPAANAIPKAGAGGDLGGGWMPYGATSGTVCEGNDSRLSDPRDPNAHAASHEDGSADEISVEGLSGSLADSQTPSSHAASHQHGGSDEVATATPGANAIPKAGAGGTLDAGWMPDGGERSKSITVESPSAAEDISIFFTNRAVTITEIRAVVRGSTPSVTWTVRHGTSRSGAGSEAVTGGTETTDESAGSDVTSFDDATIVADSFVWLETTAQTGTVDELAITIFYTEN